MDDHDRTAGRAKGRRKASLRACGTGAVFVCASERTMVHARWSPRWTGISRGRRETSKGEASTEKTSEGPTSSRGERRGSDSDRASEERASLRSCGARAILRARRDSRLRTASDVAARSPQETARGSTGAVDARSPSPRISESRTVTTRHRPALSPSALDAVCLTPSCPASPPCPSTSLSLYAGSAAIARSCASHSVPSELTSAHSSPAGVPAPALPPRPGGTSSSSAGHRPLSPVPEQRASPAPGSFIPPPTAASP